MIAVKLDEDLPGEMATFLNGRGFAATTVKLQGWTGWADVRLFDAVQGEERWLFTADKGFSGIRRYSPGTHHGIVFFRAERESRSAYIRLVSRLLETVDLAGISGSLVVVSHRGIRTVRPDAGGR